MRERALSSVSLRRREDMASIAAAKCSKCFANEHRYLSEICVAINDCGCSSPGIWRFDIGLSLVEKGWSEAYQQRTFWETCSFNRDGWDSVTIMSLRERGRHVSKGQFQTNNGENYRRRSFGRWNGTVRAGGSIREVIMLLLRKYR